jgi:hypothetical protein
VRTEIPHNAPRRADKDSPSPPGSAGRCETTRAPLKHHGQPCTFAGYHTPRKGGRPTGWDATGYPTDPDNHATEPPEITQTAQPKTHRPNHTTPHKPTHHTHPKQTTPPNPTTPQSKQANRADSPADRQTDSPAGRQTGRQPATTHNPNPPHRPATRTGAGAGGRRMPEPGRRAGCRNRVQGAGCRNPAAGCGVRGAGVTPGRRVPDAGCRAPEPRRAPDAGCQNPGAGVTPGRRMRMRVRARAPEPGTRMRAAGAGRGCNAGAPDPGTRARDAGCRMRGVSAGCGVRGVSARYGVPGAEWAPEPGGCQNPGAGRRAGCGRCRHGSPPPAGRRHTASHRADRVTCHRRG